MWHTLWIVRFREPTEMRTHIVMFGHTRHMHVSVSAAFKYACDMRSALCVSAWCKQHTYHFWHMESSLRRHMNKHLLRNVCLRAIEVHSYIIWQLYWMRILVVECCSRAPRVHDAMLAHPPNLSILVSGGEHTTLYVFSHCERTRIVSQYKSLVIHGIVVHNCTASKGAGVNLLQH